MTSFAPFSVLLLAAFGLVVLLSCSILAARDERRGHGGSPDPKRVTARSSA